jgi:tRNA threonylcarbamoyladenosine biosynthesis protein TsaB
MATFREVCRAGPVVLLDAAATQVQAGLIAPTGAARWAAPPGESGVAVFQALTELGVDPAAVRGWIFCEGPGSILGIRTVAMALRSWTLLHPAPVHRYASLAVVAHALGDPAAGIIADARRETWHHLRLGEPLSRLPTQQLQPPLFLPATFRTWSTPPTGVQLTPYDWPQLLPRVWDADLLRPAPEPDAFLHEDPSYVTWTPRIHQAPAAGA